MGKQAKHDATVNDKTPLCIVTDIYQNKHVSGEGNKVEQVSIYHSPGNMAIQLNLVFLTCLILGVSAVLKSLVRIIFCRILYTLIITIDLNKYFWRYVSNQRVLIGSHQFNSITN